VRQVIGIAAIASAASLAVGALAAFWRP